MSQTRTRTIVALVGAALLVFVAAVAAVVTVAVRHADKPEVQITAYANGKSITIAPYWDCNVRMQDCRTLPSAELLDLPDDIACATGGTGCRTGVPAELPVKPGLPLQLSFPKEISDAPWMGSVVYRLPNGKPLRPTSIEHDDYAQGTTAITIPSALYVTADGHKFLNKPAAPSVQLTLIGVEIDVPILWRDPQTGEEGQVPHTAWSVATMA
ncbi:DUF2771 family protein [Nocardia sp. NPDC059240]|uniref:DUF2771 family protein n=1 Tax=Nocardia sp. NPDC059240 TaxID=3346786 RepID=UPI0036C756EE